MLIREMAFGDNPYYRIQKQGAAVLSNAELLAIALDIRDLDIAQRVSNLWNNHGFLASIPRSVFMSLDGVGSKTADKLTAIAELISRESGRHTVERPKITCPADVATLVMYEMSTLEQEQLRSVILDTRNNVMKISMVYQGSLNSSQVRIGELFKEAIRENAAAIIVVHNHPTGDPSPSPDDISVTRGIVEAGKMLDINVLDHLIVAGGRFVSLKERGLGF